MSTSAPRPALHPYLGIVIGVLAVSAASIIIRYALAAGAPPLVIATYRLAFASLALAALVAARHRAELARLTRRDLLLAGGTGVFLAAHFAAWITSLQFTTVASSAVLVSISPLLVGVLSFVAWREKMSRALIIGLIVSLIGGVIVGLADVCAVSRGGVACPPLADFVQGRAFAGDLLALAGAVAIAFYWLIGRRLREALRVSLIPYIFLSYSTAAITLLTTVIVSRQPLVGYPPAAYFWMAVLALVPQLIGHSAFNWALRYLSATYVSVTVLGEPVGSTILAVMLLNEAPGPLKLGGGGLILVGILLASQHK
ncbi:MAG: DMT family transporter [Chloroflexi bacterium]|nr:DMT family transporter [Chloroflexota bacterium]